MSDDRRVIPFAPRRRLLRKSDLETGGDPPDPPDMEPRLRAVETGLIGLTVKLDGVEKLLDIRFTGMEKRIDTKIDGLEKKVDLIAAKLPSWWHFPAVILGTATFVSAGIAVAKAFQLL